jgi:hypothetical protein
MRALEREAQQSHGIQWGPSQLKDVYVSENVPEVFEPRWTGSEAIVGFRSEEDQEESFKSALE